MSWRAIAGFRLVTQEAGRAATFYSALGFAVGDPQPIERSDMARLGLGGEGTRVRMRRGAVIVDFDRYDAAGAPCPANAPTNATSFQHLALVTDDIARDWAAAAAAGAVAIGDAAPVALPASSGGVTAIKFRDPDGHPLELIAFPDTAPHPPIDHSAIVVSDVAASLAFYTAHGMAIGERTLNSGGAQDRLDGLSGTQADVVSLLPDQAAPHLELLGYRRPPVAVMPPAAVNDVLATRIVWRADRDALVRDPDGHLHELVSG